MQSTEEAASAIAAFMEVNDAGNEFEGSNGWMLLTSLKILSSEGDDLAEVMTGASVPSTLVKCLYLFFDLPKGRYLYDVHTGGTFKSRHYKVA